MSALRLRRATVADAGALLTWRNDPATRRHYLNPRPVRAIEHERWLRARLDDPDCLLLIAETVEGERLGQIRFDRERGVAEISVSVARNHRGQGYGATIIRRGIRAARRTWGVRRFVARVQPTNVASAIAFLKAGFVFHRLERAQRQVVYRLELKHA